VLKFFFTKPPRLVPIDWPILINITIH
jgi:hypothetical protein